MLQTGTEAPGFSLKDKDGNLISLSGFRSKKVVLYFYPKDNTSGCTKQACAFSSAYLRFKKLGVEVIGVSRDGEESHARFSDKYSLPFILLADVERKVTEAYGVWQEKKQYGKVSFGVVRTTFLIDENGKIEKIWSKAKPDTNAEEILSYLERKGE